MRILAMVAMMAVGMSARAEWKVAVYVDNDAAPGRVLLGAMATAGRMFSSAGVKLDWRGHAPDGGRLPVGAVAIGLAPRTPAGFMPGALAFARPYDGVHITVFYDRVQHVAPRPAPAAALLAHVLVHEIAHILQGIDRHSESGVMKARWTGPDYTGMAWKPLPFTPEDIDLIHRGLGSRL
jgi:hypothetical protein